MPCGKGSSNELAVRRISADRCWVSALAVVGLLVSVGGFGWFGRLPGDIRIERDTMRIYIPFASMILISIVLNLIFVPDPAVPLRMTKHRRLAPSPRPGYQPSAARAAPGFEPAARQRLRHSRNAVSVRIRCPDWPGSRAGRRGERRLLQLHRAPGLTPRSPAVGRHPDDRERRARYPGWLGSDPGRSVRRGLEIEPPKHGAAGESSAAARGSQGRKPRSLVLLGAVLLLLVTGAVALGVLAAKLILDLLQ